MKIEDEKANWVERGKSFEVVERKGGFIVMDAWGGGTWQKVWECRSGTSKCCRCDCATRRHFLFLLLL